MDKKCAAGSITMHSIHQGGCKLKHTLRVRVGVCVCVCVRACVVGVCVDACLFAHVCVLCV